MELDYRDRHVVVTGATGALGGAVVEQLLERGAVCHLPTRSEGAERRFPDASADRLRVTPGVDLTDEASVASFYGALPGLWASIHCAPCRRSSRRPSRISNGCGR